MTVRVAASTQFFCFWHVQIYFDGLNRVAGNAKQGLLGNEQGSTKELKLKQLQTQAEKLFPKGGIRALQNKARIPCFMPSPYHLGICTAPAGSMYKLNALM
jgi:hypothetical protein